MAVKLNRKKIVGQIKSKEKKENVTFRLSPSLYEEFKRVCKKEKITTTAAMEELIKAFIR